MKSPSSENADPAMDAGAEHPAVPGPVPAPDGGSPRRALPEGQPTAEGTQALPPPPPEEVDVWWGSFANRTMLPSLLVCLLATGLIGWLTWALLPGHLSKLAFLSLAGAVWLFQGMRWGHRYFGFNYRLTNRRLFCHRGFVYAARDHVELAHVARVLVKSNWWERWLGVGRILVHVNDPDREALILEGVRKRARIAEEIRVHVKRAREQAETANKGAEVSRADGEAAGNAIDVAR